MNSSKTKKTFITFLLLLFGATNIYAADYYIAQTAAGSANGKSCANAYVYTWPWTGVNDGDTVHLCGTITHTLTIPESGTSAGITVKFETGANLTSPAWGTGSGAAIYANNRSYIIIDGGTNGIIANTNNGDSLGLQQDSNAIDVTGGAHWEVKNLTIQNMYIHVSGNASGFNVKDISFWDTSYVNVHYNTLNNCYFAVWMATLQNSISNLNVSFNNISATEVSIVVAIGGSGTSINIVNLFNNILSFGTNWYSPSGGNHIEVIHVWSIATTHDAVTNLAIYNNTVSGDPSPTNTGCFYFEDQVVSPLIYNNVVSIINNHL